MHSVNATNATATLAVGLLAAGSCVGQTPETTSAPTSTGLSFTAVSDEPIARPAGDAWNADLTAWIWFLGLDGTIGVRGVSSDVNANFRDVLDASDSIFALSGRLEVRTGAWGGYVDGIYADIGVDDVPSEAGNIDVSYEESLLDFGVTYRLRTWTPAGAAAKNAQDATLDLYAGARYINLKLELAPDGMPPVARRREWFDPIVGAKLVLPFSERWHLKCTGDVGGFGVESDFTWSATAVFGYDFFLFDRPASAYAGYRGLGHDYSTGSAGDEFVFDVIQHGPIIGLSIRF